MNIKNCSLLRVVQAYSKQYSVIEQPGLTLTWSNIQEETFFLWFVFDIQLN